MSAPAISAVIPAYNAAAFLAETIASIRAQTVPVAEILVVDDGSTDGTAAVAECCGARVLRQPNRGPSAARNLGLAEARCELVAFLDADDRWTPEKTAEQLAALARHPELALIASDMAETDAEGRVRVPSVQARHGLRARFERLAGAPIPQALRFLTEINFIPTGTVLARREALLEAGGFPDDIRYGEDLVLWARVAARHPIACLPRVHMLRRRHGANATDALGPLYADLVRVMELLAAETGPELRRQGVQPAALVARALADLGYHHFERGALAEARRAFLASLRRQPTRRAAVYAAACLLPGPAVRGLRRLKQRLTLR